MDDLVQQASSALRAGNKDEARRLLTLAIRQNPDDERAWGWMYNAASSDKERIDCLNQMLRINPKNEKASQLLSELNMGDVPLERPAKSSSSQTVDPKQQKNILVGIGAILLICTICGCVFFAMMNNGTKDYKTMALVQCEIYVQNRLKSPSSAKFASTSNSNIQDLGNSVYQVNSYVDAQNSFGAMLRTDYSCKIEYTGDAASDESNSQFWKLHQLDIAE